MSAKTALVVLGMHRSGTSSVAGVLSALGATAPVTLLQPSDDNPKGFWESRLVIEVNDQLLAAGGSYWSDWRQFDFSAVRADLRPTLDKNRLETFRGEFGGAETIVLKDPRLCRIYPAWDQLLAGEGYGVGFIMPIRSPLEVAGSLQRRNDISMGEGLLLWLRHVLDAEEATRNCRRHIMMWPEFMDDWRAAVSQMASAIDWAVPEIADDAALAVDAFLSHDLQNERVCDDEMYADPHVHEWVAKTYASLKVLAKSDGDAGALRDLDRIRSDFNEASRLYFPAYGAALWRTHEASQRAGALDVKANALEASLGEGQHRLHYIIGLHEAVSTDLAASEQRNQALAHDLGVQQSARDALQADLEGLILESRAQAMEVQERHEQVAHDLATAQAHIHDLEFQAIARDHALSALSDEKAAIQQAFSALARSLERRPLTTVWRAWAPIGRKKAARAVRRLTGRPAGAAKPT